MSESARIGSIGVASETIQLSESFPTTYTDKFKTEHLFIRIETNNGTIGHGEGAILPWFTGETAESAETLVKTRFAEQLVGMPLTEIHDILTGKGSLPGHAALKTAIEMATLDCLARRRDVPLHFLLGEQIQDTIPVVHVIGAVKPDQAVESAAKRLSTGYNSFKVKVTGDVSSDRDRVHALANKLDDSKASFRIDPNTAWTDYRGAIAAFDRLGLDKIKNKLEYIEQPVTSDRNSALRRLSDQTGVSVFADESIHSPTDAIALANNRTVSGFCLKLAKSAGLRNHMLSTRIAAERGLEVNHVSAFGTSLESAAILHLASVTRNLRSSCELLPHHLEQDPVTSPIDVSPETMVPEGPGLGVRLDPSVFN